MLHSSWREFLNSLNLPKALLLILWAMVAAGALVFIIMRYGWDGVLDVTRVTNDFKAWLQNFGLLTIPIYFFIALVRPLSLIPSSVLPVTAGLIFGPWWGFFLSWIALNLSSWSGYLLARYVGRGWFMNVERGLVARLDEEVQKRGWPVVATFNWIMPLDPANFILGLSSVKMGNYLIGTAIGVIPGALTLSYLGGQTITWSVVVGMVLFIVLGGVVLPGGWIQHKK